MSKPIMPSTNGTVQIDLKAYQQWQQLTKLLVAAQVESKDRIVKFDAKKLTTALTYGLQLSDSALRAEIVNGSAPSVIPQSHYTLWPRVEGGVDLVWSNGDKTIKKGLLSEIELRQKALIGGDIVSAKINDAKQVSDIRKLDHVNIESELMTLTRAFIESGDMLGMPERLIVTHNNKTTLVDDSGMPYPYVIPQSVVAQMQLQVGDQVDLRWYAHDLMTMRLIWRY
ncbi:hypothetical protein MUDAN_DOGOELCO_01283 [Lactiplantibacillus mudanjiangensis]|uniref:hypothetical protein n=1 Tax=Lactiplantibacillus mudanjiangensis TaxID=1296538 RepID=UPI00101513F4|nr:hypothetical protein [Lactiplantibacillus mudanjiangensis]VDG31992.1 hypothetical protein MUDAN_DOGOELCO_01283 [Lactiplantibacillus mudanjiangensis]